MDGVHDMGGMHGFGPVVEAGGEQAYHEPWEGRVFAIQLLVDGEGLGAGPGARSVREKMEPAAYLAASYYERWLYSAEQRLLRKGTLAPGEIEAMMERLKDGESIPSHRDRTMAQRAVGELRAVHPMKPAPPAARFARRQRVRVKRMHPIGHTRCPRYARGAVGVVEDVRGADRLPDRATYGADLVPEAVYSVTFSSTELWGPSEEPAWSVSLDLWEDYLEGL
jgi:nitrile hydratase